MRNYFAIYVPTNDHYGRVKSHLIKVEMTHRFGGCTKTAALGGYMNKEGTYVEDSISIIKSFTQDFKEEDYEWVRIKAAEVRDDLKQECVAVEYNGEMIFV
jgi:hypothetical protein